MGGRCEGFGRGAACKPLRASDETGAFTMLVKLDEGAELKNLLHLGAADLYVLDGKVQYGKGSSVAPTGHKVLTPAYWGYIPAMSKAKSIKALEKTELLMSFYGPVAFLDSSDKVGGIFTASDLKRLAKENGVTLIPQTLADALAEPSEADRKAAAGEKLAISCSADKRKYINDCLKVDGGSLSGITEVDHHFVDTRRLPWILQGEDPKTSVSVKIVRVSPETGVVTAIVRQNGQAPPHYHLGAADFFITSGRIGYRAGPSEGYGPGVYMYEPAGARHEATQPVGDEDLIYTSNIFGPIQFDSGVGTPPLAVLSWMTYLQFAKDSNTPLIRNKLDGSYLAAPTPDTQDTQLTESQMAVRRQIIAFTKKRIADFDAGDVAGTMSGWAKEGSEFIVRYPNASTPEVKVEGFEAIEGLERTFANLIKENFGSSWHELGQWKWLKMTDEEVDFSVYCRLWLTDKETKVWKQQDLSGKTGRFWMDCKHKKFGDEWKIITQVAISEDTD